MTWRSRLSGLVLTLLFFLGSADSVFATRLAGMNFRWGQLLLLALALVSLPGAWRQVRAHAGDRETRLVVGAWGAFFLVYLASALLSPAPGLSFVKLAWALFNIGGAALALMGGAHERRGVVQGLIGGCLLVCGVIWIDALAIDWFGMPGPVLGLAQDSYKFEGSLQVRPHAFYYEPSYAGSTLAFAAPLLFAATHTLRRRWQVVVPALALSTVVLTSARTGLLSLAVGLAAIVVLSVRRRDQAALGRLGKSALCALALLLVFFLATPKAQKYGRFILGPLGPQGIYQRLTEKPHAPKVQPGSVPADSAQPTAAAPSATRVNEQSSEGARLANVGDSVRRWRERFVLGWGVAPAGSGAGDGHLLQPQTMNTWLEIALESGLLGILAFLAAVACTLRATARRVLDPQVGIFLAAAFTAHLVCNLNLTQTFPRLDYWLLFFAAVRLALPERTHAPLERALAPQQTAPVPLAPAASGLEGARPLLQSAGEVGRHLP